MHRTLRLARACLTVLAASQFFLGGAARAQQPSFEGQTIRIALNNTSGGPSDLLARQFAPFMKTYLPGNPTIIIENRPGAGGAVGANYVYAQAKPDGLTIGFLVGVVTQGLIGGENIRFDPAKFLWVGAVSQTQVLLAAKELNLSSFRDLLKPAKPLVMAGMGTNSTADVAHRLFLDMIGAKYKAVSGYPGQPEIQLALSRGEANLANAGHTLYLARRDTIRKEGLYDAVLQRGEYAPDGTFRRNPQLAEIPTMIEAITEINPAALKSVDFATNRSLVGAFAVHFGYMLPPGTPPAIVSTIRTAISGALNDPEARALVRKSLSVDYDFVDGQTSQGIVEKLRAEYHADPRIAERLKQIMANQ